MKRTASIFTVVLIVAIQSATTAAPSISKEVNTDNRIEVSHRDYLRSIAENCKKSYFPLRGFEYCQAIVSFEITSKKTVTNIKVVKHPITKGRTKPDKLADEALVQAIQKIEQLPEFPSTTKLPATVYVVFDGREKGPMKIDATFNREDALCDKPQKAVHKS